MNRGTGVLFASAFAALVAMTGSAWSQSTGLDGLHDQVRVGRKVCMKDHFHDGTGTGQDRRVAERMAVQSWEEFTALEYGPSWGSLRLAESRSMKCSRDTLGIVCHVTARPCRRR